MKLAPQNISYIYYVWYKLNTLNNLFVVLNNQILLTFLYVQRSPTLGWQSSQYTCCVSILYCWYQFVVARMATYSQVKWLMMTLKRAESRHRWHTGQTKKRQVGASANVALVAHCLSLSLACCWGSGVKAWAGVAAGNHLRFSAVTYINFFNVGFFLTDPVQPGLFYKQPRH